MHYQASKLKMHMLLLLVIALFFLSTSSVGKSHARFINASSEDEESLLRFKASIGHDPLNAFANWNSNISFCNWTGIECNERRDRVVALALTDMGLEGTISPFIANLSFLQSLDLFNNTLRGHIPQQFGRLFHLRKLWLSHNQLEGPIPATLSGCSNLVDLTLSYNNLSGSIPAELGLLTHLNFLYLAGNILTGNIPSSLGNLSALTDIDLGVNDLTGTIPSSLSNISSLIVLRISMNNLTGSIPRELGLLTNLQEIFLFQNQLTGQIPSDFCAKLTNLRELILWGNQLSGSIPISLGNCSKLVGIALSSNQLSGIVPTGLGQLPFLERLYINTNQLVGGSTNTMPFLTALTNCSHLREISMYDNQLGGLLPSTIGQLSTNLSLLSLANNNIGGNIPQQIGNLTSLTFLNFSGNLFNGTIPSALKRLDKLERLTLDHNRLQGSIPTEMGQLRKLGLFSANNNLLSGQIPDSFGRLQQLRRLLLHHNQFSGNIPASLGECQNLEVLDLSYNRFSGSIPQEVAGLQYLQLYLNLSGNSLQGSLPSEIGKMIMVQAIDISHNYLSGIIPATIGSCSALEYINMSQNTLHGPIPVSLTGLQSLQSMDLSSNFLSGTIPKSLKNLKMLNYMDLSFNNITGEVPTDGFFGNRSVTALFMGNPNLCGPHVYLLPACTEERSHSLVKRIMLGIGGIIVLILCCSLGGFLWRRHLHRQSLDVSKAIAPKLEYPRISHQELVTATSSFDKANLLGVGSFGSVYKGILNDGTIVAIKVLNLQNGESQKSFDMECKILGSTRHRNVARIITSCSNLHFKALILQFMPNGSLDKHLYPNGNESNGKDACGLGLRKRLNIAIDIAYGMEYLHHDCFVQVVHCDLKPTNILLDNNMAAHVTDFGIAQLICANSADSFSSTVALKGSVGYIAPEYGFGGRISTNGDVYSFGILLLEMMTRKPPTNPMFVNGLTLQKWVIMFFPDRIEEVVDSSLLTFAINHRMDLDEMFKCLTELIHVALMCTKESPEARPSMREIVAVLERIRGNFLGTRMFSRLP